MTRERAPQPSNREVIPVEIRKFRDESRLALKEAGCLIIPLTGQSIASLRKEGKRFGAPWHKDHPQFEAISSMRSEVAIKPGELFIPRSNNKTLTEQEKMISEFSKEMEEKVPGIKIIIGGVADYVDLAFTSFIREGYLFNEEEDGNFSRTNTPTVGAYGANVGNFNLPQSLYVVSWPRDCGNSRIFATPLVVPQV